MIVLAVAGVVAGMIDYEAYSILAQYNNLFVFATVSMIFMYFTDNQDKVAMKMGGYFISLAECSFGIYLIHPVIMNLLYKVIGLQPIMFNPVVSIPLFCVAFILPCHLTVWLMKKIPVVRQLV